MSRPLRLLGERDRVIRATPEDGLDYGFERAMRRAMAADRKAAERRARARRLADPEYRKAIVATKFALKLAGLGNDAAAHVTVGDLMALYNERAAARIGGAL